VKDPSVILILATVLGSLGMWLMLPRGGRRGRMTGTALAVAALGLGCSQAPALGNWGAEGVFAVLALVTVVSAGAAVTFRNPVYCAIWFGLSLLGTAGLFLLIGAQFLAAATVVIYAGAILVTFLFVLMLAQPEGRAAYDRASWEALLSAVTGIALVGVLSAVVGGILTAPALPGPSEEALQAGALQSQHVAALGTELYGRHLIAIQIAGVLLLATLVGAAVIVTRGKHDGAKADTSESLRK
jgi:NADH-quinone oxidoreductase subunit J